MFVRAFAIFTLVLLSVAQVPAAEPLQLPPPPKSGAAWIPGIEYIAIIPSRKTAAPAGKVEVVFRHQYTVSIFRPFEAALTEWLKTKPDYIHVVRKPHVHYPHARFQARMFLSLQEMGEENLALTKLYDWIWDEERYPIYHNLYHPDAKAIDALNLAFVRAQGLDEKRFLALYQSPKMDERVITEEADSLWELDTMAMIDGTFATDIGRTAYRDLKQLTSAQNFARFFKLIEYLAAARRPQQPKP